MISQQDLTTGMVAALGLRVKKVEERVEVLEGKRLVKPTETDDDQLEKECQNVGVSMDIVLRNDRYGVGADARYQVARNLSKLGWDTRRISRVLRRSVRSIQRMI